MNNGEFDSRYYKEEDEEEMLISPLSMKVYKYMCMCMCMYIVLLFNLL